MAASLDRGSSRLILLQRLFSTAPVGKTPLFLAVGYSKKQI